MTVPDHTITPCCGYKWSEVQSNPYPVFWNPLNRVVQCHNCGHVWVPTEYVKLSHPQQTTRVAHGTPTLRGRDGALQIEPPEQITPITLASAGGEVASWMPESGSNPRSPRESRAVTCPVQSHAAVPLRRRLTRIAPQPVPTVPWRKPTVSTSNSVV